MTDGPSRDSPRALVSTASVPAPVINVDPRSIAQAEQRLQSSASVGYRPQLPIYSVRGAEVLGWYFFADVEVMRLHDAVRLPMCYVLGPQQYAEWVIEGSSLAVVRFAADQLRWWWMNAMPGILEEGYAYGWSACEIEYTERDGLLVLHRTTTFSPRDVQPLVIQEGKKRGKSVGVRVTNLAGGKCDLWAWREDIPNKAFWYAHRPKGGLQFGESQIRPAWRYWRMLAGIDGCEEIEQLAAHRLGTGIVVVTHPNERTPAETAALPAYAENGMIHSRDVARIMAANLKAGAGLLLSSETWAREAGGGRKWDVEVKSFQTNLEGLGAYDDRLSRKCSKAIEVPPELFEAAQTGSGYSGRAIPLQGFLVGQQSNLQRGTMAAQGQVVMPLVKWNYGPQAWVNITPKPLTESVRKSSWETPGQQAQAGPAAPPQQEGP